MTDIVPKDAKLIPPEAVRVFEGIIYDVYHWDQALFDGSMAKFEMLKRPDTVVIIGIDDDQVIYLEEFQPHNEHRIAFPSGRVDPGEERFTAAKREMLEETGLSFNDWKLVGIVQPLQKIEWFVAYYVAWNLKSRVNSDPGPGEKITVKKASLAEAMKQMAVHRKKISRGNYLPEAVQEAKTAEDLINLTEYK